MLLWFGSPLAAVHPDRLLPQSLGNALQVRIFEIFQNHLQGGPHSLMVGSISIQSKYLRVVCDPGEEVGHGESAGHGYVVVQHNVVALLTQPFENHLLG